MRKNPSIDGSAHSTGPSAPYSIPATMRGFFLAFPKRITSPWYSLRKGDLTIGAARIKRRKIYADFKYLWRLLLTRNPSASWVI